MAVTQIVSSRLLNNGAKRLPGDPLVPLVKNVRDHDLVCDIYIPRKFLCRHSLQATAQYRIK